MKDALGHGSDSRGGGEAHVQSIAAAHGIPTAHLDSIERTLPNPSDRAHFESNLSVYGPQRYAAMLPRLIAGAERKAEAAGASNKPWAMGNVRLYQNQMVKYGRHLSEMKRRGLAKEG